MNALRHLRNGRLLAALALVGGAAGRRPLAAGRAGRRWPRSTRGPLLVTVDEEGETRVRDRFVVSAPVAGRVLRIELEPGDRGRRGETVVATFLPAAAALLDARTRAEARGRGRRGARGARRRPGPSGSAPRPRLGSAASELQRAPRRSPSSGSSRARRSRRERPRRRAAEEALRAADVRRRDGRTPARDGARPGCCRPARPARRGRSCIRSPIDGVVLKRLRESEAVVPAGEPLLEIGDPRQLEIVSDLLSTRRGEGEAGRAGPARAVGRRPPDPGPRARVEPSGFTKVSALGVEEQRVNVMMDFDDPLEALAALGDGYRVEVRIVVWEADSVLQVPTSASSATARTGPSSWSRRPRAAEDGRRSAIATARTPRCSRACAEGARVVLHPSDTLKPGLRVARRPS